MKSLITLLSSLFLSISVYAEVVVVVHPSNGNAIDESTINKIFVGKAKSFADGTKVMPVNQASSSGATTEFNQKVLKKSSSQLKAYWSKLVFTGKGTPPKEVDNDAAVLKMVASTPNAIGYVSAGSADASVKVVQKF